MVETSEHLQTRRFDPQASTDGRKQVVGSDRLGEDVHCHSSHPPNGYPDVT
jgi:hypothetical protein